MNNFPLLDQINEDLHAENLDWNRNAFQTLLTSNLPSKTIVFYAIHVGLRRLEESLYEPYWDTTIDALNDLSQYLFNLSIEKETADYLYEAKCQLLLYASIAMIKMNTIRRRSTYDAKLVCAMICLLLLQQPKSFENLSGGAAYSTCIRAMRSRYLKRTFLSVQWLSTLPARQFHELESNYQRYLTAFLEQLFASVAQREQAQQFIETQLFALNAHEEEAQSSGFVLIPRFPSFREALLDEHHELMSLGLSTLLTQTQSTTQKLVCAVWTLSCMIEADRVALGIVSANLLREHFSREPMDFEQKPLELNERDVIVFLLLCALQNVHFNPSESILHPYLLFSSGHLCTQQQKTWWLTAIDQTPSSDFLAHLATIRLDEERLSQYPPKAILLETARILFKSALTLYEQNAKRAASSTEQYAMQYLQRAKTITSPAESTNRTEKLFFFYSQKQLSDEEKTIGVCTKLARQCDEIKSLPEPEPPRTSSPTKSEQKEDLIISTALSPVPAAHQDPEISDSTLPFATPPSNKSRDVDVQTFLRSPSPPPPPPLPVVIEEAPEPASPSFVNLIFTHMEQVNRRINEFCADQQAMQNEIFTIRDRLDTINRLTSQMLYPDSTPSHR